MIWCVPATGDAKCAIPSGVDKARLTGVLHRTRISPLPIAIKQGILQFAMLALRERVVNLNYVEISKGVAFDAAVSTAVGISAAARRQLTQYQHGRGRTLVSLTLQR